VSFETLLAYAKLTRSLRVVGVRSDGFHLIDAEMVTLDFADVLRVREGGVNDLPADNLVSRALVAVGRTAHVRLDKRIPAGAGLGGGSADAAAILRWAGCSSVEVAVGLGADVPFCLLGAGRARVSGIGEVVSPLPDLDLAFTLLTPPLHVSTPAVYAAWDALGGPAAVDGCVNDLEAAALAVEPRLAEWRDRLGEATGLTPSLAGSGGTWFVEGAFPQVPGAVVARTRNDRP
jgi:4-diphosphocytidyl-2-C-methyl-D-erythritol kinase